MKFNLMVSIIALVGVVILEAVFNLNSKKSRDERYKYPDPWKAILGVK